MFLLFGYIFFLLLLHLSLLYSHNILLNKNVCFQIYILLTTNILSLLNFLLINFSHAGIFQKALLNSNALTALLLICSPLLVNLGYVLPADTSTPWPGLKIFRNIFWILNTVTYFSLSLKSAECSSFTTELCCLNFPPLLIRFSSSSFTMSAGKEGEKTKFLNIPNITLLNRYPALRKYY